MNKWIKFITAHTNIIAQGLQQPQLTKRWLSSKLKRSVKSVLETIYQYIWPYTPNYFARESYGLTIENYGWEAQWNQATVAILGVNPGVIIDGCRLDSFTSLLAPQPTPSPTLSTTVLLSRMDENQEPFSHKVFSSTVFYGNDLVLFYFLIIFFSIHRGCTLDAPQVAC